MTEHADIDLVRRGYEAFSTGDVATLREIIARDAVQHVGGHNTMSGAYKGVDAILAYYGQLAQDTNGTFRVSLEGVATDGAGHVISWHHVTATRGTMSVDSHGGLIFEIVGGKIVDAVECNSDPEEFDRLWS